MIVVYRPEAVGDLRKARILRSPYSIAFINDTATIIILAVMHGSRAPSVWTRRLKRP